MRHHRKLGLAAAIASAVMACGSGMAQTPAKAVLIRPAQVFTATDASVHVGWAVLVLGDKIAAVGPAASITAPAGAEVIDLPGETLTPGLMDIHSHIFLHPYNETAWDDQVLKEPTAYRTLRAGVQARATLMAGFTTLRDLGTEGAGRIGRGGEARHQRWADPRPEDVRRHAGYRRHRRLWPEQA